MQLPELRFACSGLHPQIKFENALVQYKQDWGTIEFLGTETVLHKTFCCGNHLPYAYDFNRLGRRGGKTCGHATATLWHWQNNSVVLFKDGFVWLSINGILDSQLFPHPRRDVTTKGGVIGRRAEQNHGRPRQNILLQN